MSFTSNSSTIAPKGEELTHQTSGDPTKALAKRGTARRFTSTAMPPAVWECASDYTSGLDEDALRGARIGIPSDPSDIANDVLAVAQGDTQMADDSGSMVCVGLASESPTVISRWCRENGV